LDASGRVLAEALHRETEGNPLFVSETLRHLAETGGIVQEQGRWRVTTASVADLGIPEGVREVIGRRLSRLSEPANQLLSVAAVMGREFNADVLERVSGQSADVLDASLREAAVAAVVVEPSTATGSYRFTHALIRETLLRELPIRRRVRLHRLLAEALEAHYGPRATRHAAELAHHFSEAAGNNDDLGARAVYYSRLAGEQAEAATAWEEAARQYERCIAVLTDMETAPDEMDVALLVALGRCQRNLGLYRPAWRHLMQAVTHSRKRGDGVGLARAVVECNFPWADRARIIPLLEEALAVLGTANPELRYRLLLARADWDVDPTAEAAAQEAIAVGEQHHYPTVRAFALRREYRRALQAWHFDAAERVARQWSSEAKRMGDAGGVLQALTSLSVVIAQQGRLDDADAAATEVLVTARRLHMLVYEQTALLALAGLALLRGAFDRVEAYLAEETGQNFTTSQFRTSMAEMTHGPDASLLVDPFYPSVPATLRAFAHAKHVRVWFNLGDHEVARAALEAWSETLPPPSTFAPYRIRAIGTVDECLPALGHAALVEQIYSEAALWTQVRIAAQSEARGMDHILGALALRLERVDAAEGHYQTGLAWAEQERCPVEQGRCLEGLAEVAVRRGQTAEARQCFDRAAVLFEQHGAVFYRQRLQARREALKA